MDSERAKSDSAPGEITLQVPGQDRFLGLVRGVVGRAAQIGGFTYSGIEDFSLVVDEAVVLLLEKEPRQLTLRLGEVAESSGRITVVVTVQDAKDDWPPAHDLGQDMRWQVLDALCEEVWLVEGSDPGIGLAQSRR